ncbi:MAG: choice-of-anchor D domain-containing protein [Pseudomonadota bacterium]
MKTTLRTLLALLALGHGMGCNSSSNHGIRERLPVIELAPTDLCGGLASDCAYEFLGSEAVQLGSIMTEISIFNPGEGPLEIRGVDLVLNEAGAYSMELPEGLAAALAAGEPYLVAPMKDMASELPREVSVRVRYTPVEGVDRPSSHLIIENDSTNETTVRVRLSVREAPPKIQVSPEVVDFGRVELGATGERNINVLNIGGEPLTIEHLEITGSLDFTVSAGGQEITAAGGVLLAPVVLPPNTISSLKVRFEPASANPADGTLLIYSDDPGVPDASPVLLLGNQTAPCINVNPLQINFGMTRTGTETVRPVEITACGEAPLSITGLRIAEGSSTDFSVVAPASAPTPGAPVVIPIGDSMVLNVLYTPGEESADDLNGTPIPSEGILIIENDSLLGDVAVPLSGISNPDPCPTGVIQVAEGSEVDVQTVLHLYGDQSYSPSGAITKWDWSVDQPAGSQFVFVPSSTFPNPTFEANVQGLYRFHLTVWDENGLPSCEPAMAEVLVISDCNIHVELLWHTPEDPDETDEGPEAGSDLDLHFLHPWAGGPDVDGDGQPDGWFDQPFDCFWFNGHPQWGSFSPSVNDDPDLDRDDTDGAGPENINLCGTPEDALYRVGVHYWNDHGYGASYATVRIYVFGQLVFEVSDVKLMPCDMWEVATVEWPSGKVKLVTDLDGAQYKITPTYTNPFFVSDCN